MYIHVNMSLGLFPCPRSNSEKGLWQFARVIRHSRPLQIKSGLLSASMTKISTIFGAASALMSDFFAQIASVSNWMQLHGLDPAASARYASALYESLAFLATKESAESLSLMSDACQTTGGLNEQFFTFRQSCGIDQSLHDGLNQILERLKSSE